MTMTFRVGLATATGLLLAGAAFVQMSGSPNAPAPPGGANNPCPPGQSQEKTNQPCTPTRVVPNQKSGLKSSSRADTRAHGASAGHHDRVSRREHVKAI